MAATAETTPQDPVQAYVAACFPDYLDRMTTGIAEAEARASSRFDIVEALPIGGRDPIEDDAKHIIHEQLTTRFSETHPDVTLQHVITTAHDGKLAAVYAPGALFLELFTAFLKLPDGSSAAPPVGKVAVSRVHEAK